MNSYHEELAKLLLSKNDKLSYNQARTWVELLWEDFETTYAKAGWEYKGSEMTERIVKQWIENYGEKLHEFAATNPKYKDLLKQDKNSLN
ncbi:YfhJ family protein [Bacillus sp. sid0103]|uniref:YfhJ family protein n=1 Tax=Bacillus sp. sid0103 TaxID=2856337 RepID=UPI001C47DFAD|nr:YfhJ family protein [Bacillus sp. sid0103]MBV7506429.1 YfhJ family protein [Bacillus sp. sid0103]